jgi:hypothetical protein
MEFANARIVAFILAASLLLQGNFPSRAQAPLRRPLSPQTPMFLFQVQQTDPADPQADINAVPPDVRPYTVMMYCLGAQSGTMTNGYAMADYFCNVCRQNGMWCMVQCASGYANTMNNTNVADYQALFQKYPNLVGFAFAEQDWGFGSVATTSEFGPSTFPDRLELFARLLQLCSQYGGFLYESEMETYGGNKGFNAVAKLKSNADFRNATVAYITNFIIGNKFTEGFGYYDNESCSLGTFLSGHAGYYAARFDEFAWPWSGKSQLYGLQNPGETNLSNLPLFSCPEPAQGIPIVDHLMLQGATVIDGPEVPSYSTIYQGRLMPCYQNMTGDIFRKVLDGTIQIPSRADVLARAPIAYVADSTDFHIFYETTGDLYDGLYMMDGDGTNNLTWFKKSGRYFSIPEVYTNAPYEMSFFQTNVLQTQITNRWPTIAAKTNELNTYGFPAEYTAIGGPFFAARRENRWFTYNPWVNSNITAGASIPLQYNTCTNIALTYPPQTFAVITESNQSLQIYFNNYLTDKNALWVATNDNTYAYIQTNFITHPPDDTTNTVRTTIFQVSGCTNAPAYTLADRGNHPATTNSSSFVNGVFTLTLTGNGPCDITVNCSGSAVRTNAVPMPRALVPPAGYVPGVPAAPAGLTVLPGNGQAILAWHATNCLYYNIKRGPSLNGPFTNIAMGITNSVNLYSSFVNGATVYNATCGYTDAGVTVSNTFYYVVSAVNVSGEGPNSGAASVTMPPAYSINPVADAYVQDGSDANNNYGSAVSLNVKQDPNGVNTSFNRLAYLKFNVQSLGNASGAQLTLMPYWTGQAYTNFTTTASIVLVTNDNWTETGITWNNQPAGSGTVISNLTLNFTVGVPVTIGIPVSILASRAANDGYLSLMVTGIVANFDLLQFCSREFPTSSWRPALAYTLPSSLPPIINSFSLAAGYPQISVSGEPNVNYTLLTSSNLVNWQALLTTNLVYFPFTFVDTNSPANSARFYRIQIGP